ncbi:MAG: hypothetical protein ACRCTN_11060 [Carnobacterium maltaromaticum]
MSYENLTKEELITQLNLKDNQLLLLKYDIEKQRNVIYRMVGIMITVSISTILPFIVLSLFN